MAKESELDSVGKSIIQNLPVIHLKGRLRVSKLKIKKLFS